MPAKQSGTVKHFNAKRGFGFITPNGGGEDVFVHWEAIQSDDRWPKLEDNMKVQFTTETDENGRVKAQNVTKGGGGKIAITSDDKTYGDFRYPGIVKWFRGNKRDQADGFGFITLSMEASVGGETIKEGEDVYVSREEILAENPVNPKIASGMEVEFLVAKAGDKFQACEVTLPGGVPVGELPEREERPRGSKGKGKGSKGKGKGSKGKGKGKGKGVQHPISKPPAPAARPAKGKGKGKGKKGGKGRA